MDIDEIVQGETKKRRMDWEIPSFEEYKRKYLKVVENLSSIDFEINGVLRQAKYPAPTTPDISESLQNEILR